GRPARLRLVRGRTRGGAAFVARFAVVRLLRVLARRVEGERVRQRVLPELVRHIVERDVGELPRAALQDAIDRRRRGRRRSLLGLLDLDLFLVEVDLEPDGHLPGEADRRRAFAEFFQLLDRDRIELELLAVLDVLVLLVEAARDLAGPDHDQLLVRGD